MFTDGYGAHDVWRGDGATLGRSYAGRTNIGV